MFNFQKYTSFYICVLMTKQGLSSVHCEKGAKPIGCGVVL